MHKIQGLNLNLSEGFMLKLLFFFMYIINIHNTEFSHYRSCQFLPFKVLHQKPERIQQVWCLIYMWLTQVFPQHPIRFPKLYQE